MGGPAATVYNCGDAGNDYAMMVIQAMIYNCGDAGNDLQ
jgi:hydroxymethylpyrimidine pyrophosphatase-like HAD family hydrolase